MKPDARVKQSDFRTGLIFDTKEVNTMIEKFRDKCGAADLKKDSSKFGVAIGVKLS